MNLQAIAKAAAVEAERQQVGLKELGYLIQAYGWMAEVAPWGSDPDVVLYVEDICTLAELVEPRKNLYYRITPVTFQNGGSSASHENIPRLFDQLVFAFNDSRLSVEEFIKELLWVHPWEDGNGRVGWLLLNYLNNTMDNPQPLPDFFGE